MKIKAYFTCLVLILCLCAGQTALAESITRQSSDGTWITINVPEPHANKHMKAQKIERLDKRLTSGTITFNITYADVGLSSGFGFDDPTEGATRRACLEAVLTYLGTIIDETATIDVLIDPSGNNPGSGELAHAGTYFRTSTDGFKPGAAFYHLTTGADHPAFSSVEDIFVEVNFGKPWHSDHATDPSPSSGDFDLFSVLLHEVSHGLGITSTISSDGTGQLPSNDKVFTIFDSFLEDSAGTPFINPSTFVPQGVISDLTNTGQCYFTGPFTVAHEGGDVEVYTPSSFSNGSSIAHWNIGYDANAVMNPFIAAEVKRRVYSSFEITVLADLGYTVNIESDLELSVSSPTTANVGNNIIYSVTLTNVGPSAATNVTVDAPLPANTTYGSDDSGGDYNSVSGLWTIASLASGANITLNITHQIDHVGTFDYYAEVTASDYSDPDSTVNNASTNEDDDDSSSTYSGFTVTETSVSVGEDASSETFDIVLNGSPASTVTIRLTEDDADDSEVTIDAGSGPSAGPVDITFDSGDWDTPKTITITGKDDSVIDGAKDVTITIDVLSGPTVFTDLDDKSVIATNTDDGETSVIFADQIIINGTTTLQNVSSFTYYVNSSSGATGNQSVNDWDVTIPLDINGDGEASLNFNHSGGTDSTQVNVSETLVPMGGG